ncbi:MAG: helix-turn-helix transcriptional regulator [Alphaproteobacteria bacterium]|nr:helix-turn-helix transcriptional regulator [Alphaproteobacteria bacterium]
MLGKEMMSVPETDSATPDPVDIHVGERVRLRRTLVGLSQGNLGKSLGISFQQVQKYERGINRMGASRLFQIAQILSVPVEYFFNDLTIPKPSSVQHRDQNADHISGISAEILENSPPDIMHRRETLELVRSYYLIKDAGQRRRLYELMRSMVRGK